VDSLEETNSTITLNPKYLMLWLSVNIGVDVKFQRFMV